MPVARIISSSFEDALKFADYLRPLFDTVEIAQPGRASDTSVDLEVNLELCTPQEAWQQIAQLSQQPESEIIVAPGTLFAEGEAGEQAVAELPGSEGMAVPPPQEFDGDPEVNAAIAQASAAVAAAAGSNGSGTHKADSAVTAPEAELNWLGRTRESLRQWLAVRALLREIRQMQQREQAQERNRQRQMALQFERQRREREAQEFALARAAQPPAVQETEQNQAGLEAVPSEPQLIAQRQAQAEELRRQAEQEEAVQRGLFVEEILRRRAQEQASDAMPPSTDAETVPVEFQTVPAESFLERPEPASATRFTTRGRNSRLRPAMALAGVTSVLLTAVLVGYAHRRPASPVPLSVVRRSNVVEQKVPFGPASISAPAQPATAQAQTETLLAAAPIPERHTSRDDFRRVRVDRHEVDYVSDDVTIRHFDDSSRANTVRHPARAVPVTARSGRVKQISDME